jgi:hypothetical protein
MGMETLAGLLAAKQGLTAGTPSRMAFTTRSSRGSRSAISNTGSQLIGPLRREKNITEMELELLSGSEAKYKTATENVAANVTRREIGGQIAG